MTKKHSVHFILTLIAHARHVEAGGERDGGELGVILRQLTEREVAEGGPYALDPGGKANSVDVGLNLAVARFLAAYDVHLPRLDAYLDDVLRLNTITSVIEQNLVEELIRWYQHPHVRPIELPQVGVEAVYASEDAVMKEIREIAQTRFARLTDESAESAHAVIERTIKGNTDKQMTLMAHFMRQALAEVGEDFTDRYVAELGFANACFWTAFIVYDDFWDEDEAADPRLLPIANILARHYTDFFTSLLPEETGFRAFFNDSMDQLDVANAWETRHCRMQKVGRVVQIPDVLPAYGDFGIKYYPAAGHVLGPVALLVRAGYAVDSAEVVRLVEYFKHYLIAMQLNDDAHDWKEDIERGHISTAVFLLLQEWQQVHPGSREIHLDRNLGELEELFWFKVLGPLCQHILRNTDASRRALYALSCVQHRAPLEQFIIRNEQSANRALREHQASIDFLRGFQI